MLNPPDQTALELNLTSREAEVIYDALSMGRDVANKQGDRFLKDLGELVMKGAPTPTLGRVTLGSSAFPSVVRSAAYAAFVLTEAMVRDGTTDAGAIDQLEDTLIWLIKTAREKAAETIRDVNKERAQDVANLEKAVGEMLGAMMKGPDKD